jgi:transcriptional regulator with XRE-family HTH domain
MEQEKIGKFISERRKDKNLTQREFAEKLGVIDKTVSRWENGHYLPDISLFNDVCEILDIEVTELLKGEKINKIEKKDVDNTITKIVNISKKEIKQKNRFMVIVYSLILLFIIILSFFVSHIKSDIIEIQLTNWNTYDDNINNIKANMDKITSNSKDFYWW